MARYLGIVFNRHDEAYKAKITIIDTTANEDVIRDVYVDLYLVGVAHDSELDEKYTWWFKVDHEDHTYDIYVANGGAGLAGAGAGVYGSVEVVEFLDYVTLDPARPSASLLLLWQNDRPHIHMFSDIAMNSKTELLKSQSFVADGTLTSFTLSDENTAASFHSFSTDGGVTWKTPYDLSIVWGSNSPDYDNEQIDEEGFFSVRFFTPPAGGDVIIIRFHPVANRARVYTIFNLARNSNDSFIDMKTPSRVLDYSLELFK